MSNTKSGTDKNESSIVHSAHTTIDYVGKKTAFADVTSFGMPTYLGEKLASDSMKDQLRSDFKLLWSNDNIILGSSAFDHTRVNRAELINLIGGGFRVKGGRVSFGQGDVYEDLKLKGQNDLAGYDGISHFAITTRFGAFEATSVIKVTGMETTGGSDMKGMELTDSDFDNMFNGGATSQHPLSGQYKSNTARNGQSMLISVKFTNLTYEEYEQQFLSLVENEHQHPGKAKAFFRSVFLGGWHARYVLYGIKPDVRTGDVVNDYTSNTSTMENNVPNNYPHYPALSAPQQENFNSQILIVNLYEQYFEPIDHTNCSLSYQKIYEDHFIELAAPLHKEEVEVVNTTSKVNQINIEPNYNFYNHKYETKISEMNLETNPTYLPNMYLMLQNEYDQKPGSTLENIVTVDSHINSDLVKFVNDKGEKEEVQIDPIYFQEWVKAHSERASDPAASTYLQKLQTNQNLIFLMGKANYLKDYNKYANKFPMANTISFSAMRNNPLADSLKKTKIDYSLLRTLQIINNSPEDFYDSTYSAFSTKNMIKGTHLFSKTDNNDIAENAHSANVRPVRSIDLNKWLSNNFASGENYLSELTDNPDELVRVLGENIESAGFSYSGPHFFQKLVSIVFEQKLNQLAEKYLRSHQAILAGAPAYHEIIAYRIAKHRVVNGEIESTPEQNFYIANADELDEIIYHDTQVTYGSEYKYLVYAYAIVIGNKYKYDHINMSKQKIPVVGQDPLMQHANEPVTSHGFGPAPDDAPISFGDGCYFRTNVYTYASYKLLELPYYGFEDGEKSTGYMFDDPPVPPDVDIGGYRGINNKIQITLFNSYGEYIEKPIVLENLDNDVFNNAIRYQSLSKKQVADGKVRFKSDDLSSRFEVFRIGPDIVTGKTRAPTGFYDFQGKKIKIVGNMKSDSSSLVDTILPNTKYYYIFRSIDGHNNISNPSAVYEVELINNPTSNLSYTSIKTHDFKAVFDPVTKKSMRRYMHIEPRLEQKTIDFDLNDPEVDKDAVIQKPPMPGIVEDSLFVDSDAEHKENLKKFKIRLTSKRSGKKIDVNIKFIRSYNKLKKPQVF